MQLSTSRTDMQISTLRIIRPKPYAFSVGRMQNSKPYAISLRIRFLIYSIDCINLLLGFFEPVTSAHQIADLLYIYLYIKVTPV